MNVFLKKLSVTASYGQPVMFQKLGPIGVHPIASQVYQKQHRLSLHFSVSSEHYT